GTAQFGISDGGAAIQSAVERIPIRTVAGLTQTSPIAVIVRRDSGITKPKDLEGKTIGGGQSGAGGLLFPGGVKANGVDPDKVPVVQVAAAARNALLLDGKVDGVPGFLNGDFVIFKSRGLDPVAIRYVDYGFNVPGSGLIANDSIIKEKPHLVRGFVA